MENTQQTKNRKGSSLLLRPINGVAKALMNPNYRNRVIPDKRYKTELQFLKRGLKEL